MGRPDTIPPTHSRRSIPCFGEPTTSLKPEECDEDDSLHLLSNFVAEIDGESQEFPKPSITKNRSRQDRLPLVQEGEEESVEAAYLLRGADRREVWLHVYDLGPLTSRLNELVLQGANLGAFHAGVEVLNTEWSFMGFCDAWDDHELSGVVKTRPRQHPLFIFRESLFMGMSSLSERDIAAIIKGMGERWRANSYHWVSRNCIDFAQELLGALGTTQPFPVYLRGAMDLGKSPAVFPVADLGWTWFKWMSARQSEKESAELHDDKEQPRVKHKQQVLPGQVLPGLPKISTSSLDCRMEALGMQSGENSRQDSLVELADAQAQLARDLERLQLAKSRLQSALREQSEQKIG